MQYASSEACVLHNLSICISGTNTAVYNTDSWSEAAMLKNTLHRNVWRNTPSTTVTQYLIYASESYHFEVCTAYLIFCRFLKFPLSCMKTIFYYKQQNQQLLGPVAREMFPFDDVILLQQQLVDCIWPYCLTIFISLCAMRSDLDCTRDG